MTNFALPRPLQKLLAALTATLCAAAPAIGQNVIRGAVPGWPGNTAYYAPQTVYQYQAIPAGGAPVVQARYDPQPAVTAYYAPASAARIAYAVPAAGSYQISYAGVNQPGVATTAYYGGYNAPVQRVAYMPQQIYYAPQAAGTPVTYYRTVVAYQPGAVVAPQTCGYAATACQTATVSSCASSCGSTNRSCWRPFGWLWGNNSCGNSCNKPQTCNYGGCGATAAPYYVAPPVVPVVPAPVTSPFGRTIVTPGTTTIPPPGTRSGPGGTIMSAPADTRPMLGNPPAGVPVNPNPTFTPAPSFGAPSPSFGAPAPGGSFPSVPGTVPPDGVRDDRFRPTLVDPYSQPAAPTAPANNAPIMLAPPPSSGSQSSSLQPGTSQPSNVQPSSQIHGSGYSSDRTNLIPANPAPAPANRPSTISEPGFIGPPSSVQPLRDPHGEDRNQPSSNNRAPQLITPGDRTATNGQRWAVIPAVWPKSSTTKTAELQAAYSPQQPAYSQQKPVPTAPLAPVVAPTQLDDGGWKSAR